MRSSLTKLDLINLVRVKTGKGIESTVDEEMNLIYRSRYEFLLSMFPWSFATDSRRLERTVLEQDRQDETGYRYSYEFPIDGLFMWDLYYDPAYRKYRDLSRWDGNPYVYLEFPIDQIGELAQSSHIGEIIDGKLYSDWGRMYAFITSAKEVPTEKFNNQFLKLLENAMEEIIVRGKDKTEGELGYIESANKREGDRAKAVSSNENKGLRTVPRSKTLSRIDALT